MSVGCDVGWQVIQLPQLYIHNNWPIRVLSFLYGASFFHRWIVSVRLY